MGWPRPGRAAAPGVKNRNWVPRQVTLARAMYAETGEDGKRRYTVAQIAAEFGVTRPTIYWHLPIPYTELPSPQSDSRGSAVR